MSTLDSTAIPLYPLETLSPADKILFVFFRTYQDPDTSRKPLRHSQIVELIEKLAGKETYLTFIRSSRSYYKKYHDLVHKKWLEIVKENERGYSAYRITPNGWNHISKRYQEALTLINSPNSMISLKSISLRDNDEPASSLATLPTENILQVLFERIGMPSRGIQTTQIHETPPTIPVPSPVVVSTPHGSKTEESISTEPENEDDSFLNDDPGSSPISISPNFSFVAPPPPTPVEETIEHLIQRLKNSRIEKEQREILNILARRHRNLTGDHKLDVSLALITKYSLNTNLLEDLVEHLHYSVQDLINLAETIPQLPEEKQNRELVEERLAHLLCEKKGTDWVELVIVQGQYIPKHNLVNYYIVKFFQQRRFELVHYLLAEFQQIKGGVSDHALTILFKTLLLTRNYGELEHQLKEYNLASFEDTEIPFIIFRALYEQNKMKDIQDHPQLAEKWREMGGLEDQLTLRDQMPTIERVRKIFTMSIPSFYATPLDQQKMVAFYVGHLQSDQPDQDRYLCLSPHFANWLYKLHRITGSENHAILIYSKCADWFESTILAEYLSIQMEMIRKLLEWDPTNPRWKTVYGTIQLALEKSQDAFRSTS